MLEQPGLSLEEYKQILEEDYKTSYKMFKEFLTIEKYKEEVLESEEFNITDEEAEVKLDIDLQQMGTTLEEYKQLILENPEVTYEEVLQHYKKEMFQEYLIEELRQNADIKYM